MLRTEHSLADKYLDRLRRVGEEAALRRVRATAADLRVWRRDPAFREAERAAIAAPPPAPRVIDLRGNLDEPVIVTRRITAATEPTVVRRRVGTEGVS